jgi:surface antigen
MRASAVKHFATRTALTVAVAATAMGLTGCLTPASAVAAGLLGTAPAAVAPEFEPSVAVAGPDLPVATVRDDFPWRLYATKFLNGDTFLARQCSSFALWRIDYRLQLPTNSTLIRLVRAYRMTGAKDLDNAAVLAGYRVDRTPSVGALAQYEAGAFGAGVYGHVAFVARVYNDGTVLLEEYNAIHPLAYNTRRISAGAVSHYLHLARR